MNYLLCRLGAKPKPLSQVNNERLEVHRDTYRLLSSACVGWVCPGFILSLFVSVFLKIPLVNTYIIIISSDFKLYMF